jgi:hypothetical protein
LDLSESGHLEDQEEMGRRKLDGSRKSRLFEFRVGVYTYGSGFYVISDFGTDCIDPSGLVTRVRNLEQKLVK